MTVEWVHPVKQKSEIEQMSFAVRNFTTGKWRGIYQSPDIGVKFYKVHDVIREFDSSQEAEIAASRAKDHEINQIRRTAKVEPFKVTKTFVPQKRKSFNR